eukprot:434399-Pyramimonas_sp.AAC.1
MDPSDPQSGSWLTSKGSGTDFRIGCLLCAEGGDGHFGFPNGRGLRAVSRCCRLRPPGGPG